MAGDAVAGGGELRRRGGRGASPGRPVDGTAAAGDAKSAAPPAAPPQIVRTVSEDWPDASDAGMQRAAITALLSIGMLLVLLAFGGYCWLDYGRAELADSYRNRSHFGDEVSPADTCETGALQPPSSDHLQPALHVNRQYVAEVVSGGLNGLLMMIATVLGGIGADLSGRSIFAMGSASLVSYSVSAGIGTFLIESVREEFSVAQLAEERLEVQTLPEEEMKEMICHYRRRGISEQDAQAVARILSKYETFWVEHMMSEELGVPLPRGPEAPFASGAVTSASLLFFGALPLLGVASSVVLSRWRGPQWYRPQFSTSVSLSLSAGVLLLLGVLVSRAAGSRSPCITGLLMLINGCAASLLAFWLSQVCTTMSNRGAQTVAGGQAVAAVYSDGTMAAEGMPSPAARRSFGSPRSVGAAAVAAAATAAAAAVAAATSPTHHAHAGGGGATASLAWPSFRAMFLRGLCLLWVGACSVIVGMQLLERMAYDSLRVFFYGWITCITTGLGAVPFMFVGSEAVGEQPVAIANAVAGGMMLAASGSMLMEAHEHCGPKDWQIIAGLSVGALFIRVSEHLHSSDGEEGGEADVVALHCAFVERRHLRKAMLIFTVMFCHSAAEGVAVGVAFSKNLREEFGLYVTLLLAVHNVPEGLAVALVLVPRGVSARLAALIATLTSVPQPLLALASFLFVDAFQGLLPLGLAFAAGAMVYVCLHELLGEAVEQLGWIPAVLTTFASFVAMCFAIVGMQGATGA